MIDEIKFYKDYLHRKLRKGQVSSVPITQIIKIVVAILVASAILAIFIPVIFRSMDSACNVLKDMIEKIDVLKELNDSLGFLECN